MACLGILLLRAGLEINLKGKGMLVFLLSFIPITMEAICDALLVREFFGIPFSLCFALGFSVGGISLAILVPA